MKINKNELRQRILDYNNKCISEKEEEQLWDDLTEICFYQIKKSRKDDRYRDFVQDMVIYILENYLPNFTYYKEDGVTENSALAFLLQSSYWTKLVLWNNQYKHESREFPTMNLAANDDEKSPTEIIDTWSEESYASVWEHAWGKSLPKDPFEKVKKKKKKTDTDSEEQEDKSIKKPKSRRSIFLDPEMNIEEEVDMEHIGSKEEAINRDYVYGDYDYDRYEYEE